MTDPTTEFALVDDKFLRALLVPYGEIGTAGSGDHVFSLGVTEIPSPASITLKLAHDGTGAKQIAADCFALNETPKGIVADYMPRDNAYGKRLLEEHRAGRKKSISPEFAGIVRNGINVVKAKLTGSAAVVLGGFPSATFFAFEEATEETPAEEPVVSPVADVTPDPEPAPADEETPKEEEEPVATATVPNTLQGTVSAPEQPIKLDEVFAYFADIQSGVVTPEQRARMDGAFHVGGEMTAFALNDVKYNGTGSVQPDERRSQWIDELWSGRTTERVVVPLFAHDTLRARIVSGFKWTTKPAGGDWGGNKSNIPSNQPVTAPATATSQFWAMGHDHAIEHRIFNTPGYFESYFKMGREDYAQWSDAEVLTAILAAATTVEADNPSGLTIGAGFSALIDGATEVIAKNAIPTFALVHPTLYKSMLKTPDNAVLGYLDAALGLEDGSLERSGFVIRPHASLSAGNVLVGAKQAATVYELPDIIKVEAPDTVKGGIDTNMIGAVATFIHKADALQLVTPYTP